MKTPPFDAVIFDMDGLMLDTEGLVLKSFLKAASEFGCPIPESVYFQTIGRTWPDTKQLLCAEFGAHFPFDDIRQRTREYTNAHIAERGVECKAGLGELLDLLENRKLPKAVATSTGREKALDLLQRVDLLRRFDAVVGGDEVSRGKPDPEIFLIAARRLNVEPWRCMVLEDSAAGTRAAHSAGMIPILVPDLVSPAEDVIALAYRVFVSLREVRDLFDD